MKEGLRVTLLPLLNIKMRKIKLNLNIIIVNSSISIVIYTVNLHKKNVKTMDLIVNDSLDIFEFRMFITFSYRK
jgi:hypothetical protein